MGFKLTIVLFSILLISGYVHCAPSKKGTVDEDLLTNEVPGESYISPGLKKLVNLIEDKFQINNQEVKKIVDMELGNIVNSGIQEELNIMMKKKGENQ